MSRDNATGSVGGNGDRGHLPFKPRLFCGGPRGAIGSGFPIHAASDDPSGCRVGLRSVDALAILCGVHGLKRLLPNYCNALFAEVQLRKQYISVRLRNDWLRPRCDARPKGESYGGYKNNIFTDHVSSPVVGFT